MYVPFAYIYAKFMTLFTGDEFGTRGNFDWRIINSPLSREEREEQTRAKRDAHERARKGAPLEVEPETKRDVNLAHKTLFSPGKVVNGRLGIRLPIVRRRENCL